MDEEERDIDLQEYELQTLLECIGNERITFNQLCQALGDGCPKDKASWRELFLLIQLAEDEDLIKVSRLSGMVKSIILTDEGLAEL